MKITEITQSELIGQSPTEYDEVTPLEWAEYEFSTIEYDYRIPTEAAQRIREIFKRYIKEN